MYAMFDVSEKDTVRLSLFDEGKRLDRTFTAANRDLLKCFDDFLRERGLAQDAIEGILVLTGAGGFTSTRIAAVVANGFAYARGVPVAEVSFRDAERLEDCIAILRTARAGRYISPAYSGEPNISRRV